MRLLDWLEDYAPLGFLVLVLLAGFVAIAVIFTHAVSLPPRECSDYADSLMKDVPVRCLEYWTNPR